MFYYFDDVGLCWRNAQSMSLFYFGEYALAEWIGAEKQGVATEFYGLGTMNITPLHGMTDLTTRVWV